ncbi:hypothetical protein HOLDEFILI_01849 [Holdemania filiformis DSM 12042]|uniref:Uncharacterized protein n=1 Tax=Holdemania filiformis DSM 12042 TaxID=545696 RepID=B9Y7Q5_9FIRM|nr:hypothetical protein HOLDEFILI_01849 [Holdemania filiformis DSM 12042]
MFMFIKSTSLYIILKKCKEGKENLTKAFQILFFKRFLFRPPAQTDKFRPFFPLL